MKGKKEQKEKERQAEIEVKCIYLIYDECKKGEVPPNKKRLGRDRQESGFSGQIKLIKT